MVFFLELIFLDRYDYDISGKLVYLKKCEEIGVQLIMFFLKYMYDIELVMKYYSFGLQGMKVIVILLEVRLCFLDLISGL